MDVLFILLGIAIGAAAAWLIANFKFKSERGISQSELETKYIPKELYARLNDEYKKEIEALHEKSRITFENVANQLLKNESKEFAGNMLNFAENMLNPLREQLKDFEDKARSMYETEGKEREGLRRQVELMGRQTERVSEEANNLVDALKGDNKMLGNWGELQLKTILEIAGLKEGVTYKLQVSFEDTLEDEQRRKQPDVVITLPEGRHLIVDSKASLLNYQRYFNAKNNPALNENPDEYIEAFMNDVKNHIDELSTSDYKSLCQINSPDFVLMFMPIEPALAMVFMRRPQIYEYALRKNVILLTTSTLLATLRTIAYIWRQENLKKNVASIIKRSSSFLDKLNAFAKHLQGIGAGIDRAREAYDNATASFSTGRGNLLERARRLEELGVSVKEQLPQQLMAQAGSDEEEGAQE